MTQYANTEGAKCELRRSIGMEGVPCDRRECTYWRIVEHIDTGELPTEGCAIQHFELLGDKGADVAAWLWSVKRRIEELDEDER